MDETGASEPKSIGKYDIETTLGTGSMGVVYRARDPEIGRVVAIKTLRTVYLGEDANSEAMQRFRQESRSAGKLRHPNIVTVFEAGRTETGTPYIVMEYLDGLSLEEVIAQRAPLDPAETLHLLAAIGSAIDYAHGQGVIHRDIKPSNVILDSHGAPFLLDFGVAKLTDTSLTPAGMVVGTPSYMAPEQIRGEQLDGSTDRFALAVMVYEGLTGERPFAGTDFTTVVSNIIHQSPRRVKEIASKSTANELPEALDAVFAKSLAKDRNDRHSSCAEMMSDIGRALGLHVDSQGVSGYRPGVTWKSLRNPLSSGQTAQKADQALPVDSVNGPNHAASKSDPSSRGVKVPVSDSSRQPHPDPSSSARSPANLGFSAALVFLFLIAATAGTYLLAPDIFHGPYQDSDLDTQFASRQNEKDQIEQPPVAHSVEVDAPTDADPLTSEVAMVVVDEVDGGGDVHLSAVSGGLQPEPASNSAAVQDDGATPVTEQRRLTKVSSSISQVSDEDVRPASQALGSTKSTEDPKTIVARVASADPDAILPELLTLARHPDYTVRIAVLKALVNGSQLKSRDVLRVMVDSLNDEEFLVRGFAVKTLATLNNRAALILIEERKAVETHDIVNRVIDESIEHLKKALQSSSGNS